MNCKLPGRKKQEGLKKPEYFKENRWIGLLLDERITTVAALPYFLGDKKNSPKDFTEMNRMHTDESRLLRCDVV
jgi:hypothetical protein